MVRKSKTTQQDSDRVRVLDGGENSPSNEAVSARQVDIGFDISTSVIGICIIDAQTDEVVLLTHLNLKNLEDEYDKSDAFKVFLDALPEFDIRHIFIEQAAMMFTAGMSTAQTLMTLSRFNGIASRIIYEKYGKKPKMVHVSSARAKLGIKLDRKDKSKSTKEKVLSIVMSRHPDLPWISHMAKAGKHKGEMVFDKVNEDMADAYVICKGGKLVGAAK